MHNAQCTQNIDIQFQFIFVVEFYHIFLIDFFFEVMPDRNQLFLKQRANSKLTFVQIGHSFAFLSRYMSLCYCFFFQNGNELCIRAR